MSKSIKIYYEIPCIGTIRNIIKNIPNNQHSYSSLIMLNDYYRKIEINQVLIMLGFKSIKEVVKDPKVYSNNYVSLKVLRSIFNQRFLSRKYKELGNEFRCEYCNTRVHIENSPNKICKATVDHKNPLSENCDWFDETNLAICCSKCNNEKENMPYLDWCNKLKSLT